MHRILVTAARDLPEAETVWVPLWMALHAHRAIIVTHGANPAGGDLYAHQWFGLPEQSFNRNRRHYESRDEYLAIEDPVPADWSRGKVGGPLRNQVMVGRHPDEVYAFPTPKSQGTLDCMARAWISDIPVWIYHHLGIDQRRLMTDEEGERLARRKLGWGR